MFVGGATRRQLRPIEVDGAVFASLKPGNAASHRRLPAARFAEERVRLTLGLTVSVGKYCDRASFTTARACMKPAKAAAIF